jgi:hypothetical protein
VQRLGVKGRFFAFFIAESRLFSLSLGETDRVNGVKFR